MLNLVTAPPSRRNRRPRTSATKTTAGGGNNSSSSISGGASGNTSNSGGLSSAIAAAAFLGSSSGRGSTRFPLGIVVVGLTCLVSLGVLPIVILDRLDQQQQQQQQKQQPLSSAKQPNQPPKKVIASVHQVVHQQQRQQQQQKQLQGKPPNANQHHPLLKNNNNNNGAVQNGVVKGEHPLLRLKQQEAQEEQQQNKQQRNKPPQQEDHVANGHDVVMVPPPQEQQQPQHQSEVLHEKRVGPPQYTLRDLVQDDRTALQQQSLARGMAGVSPTPPALTGARRAQIQCTLSPDDKTPFIVDSLAYWNDPQGTYDQTFASPFAVSQPTKHSLSSSHKDDKQEQSAASRNRRRYITFNPDRGGWNNIRMSMEIIFVIAAATGRTLVLPPKEPLYLLNKAANPEHRHRGFADFFPLEHEKFQAVVPTLSMEDFLQQPEIVKLLQQHVPDEATRQSILAASDHCDHRAASTASCTPLRMFLNQVGTVPNISATQTCLIFDEATYVQGQHPLPSSPEHQRMQTLCGTERTVTYWDAATYQDPLVLHFKADEREYRLLAHFYSMIHFTNPKHDHHFKRFVRDFLHYRDEIFCAAGKIIKALQKEGQERGDQYGPYGYSALHVRRGDLQYKRVKISAQEWYDNTKEVWQPGELLYVATDERNKGFFNDLAKHHDLRFLDDYWELAGLKALDGNYMGMIDTIVASRGRAFAGTWFSTFSGYINRMRGYHGMTMKDSWYSFLPKKNETHSWPIVDSPKYAYEWPDGWVGIDGDEFPTRDKF